jgi:hypothetical protein
MDFSVKQGGGSAVIFENKGSIKEQGTRGKIVFHKPHPVPKIDPIMLHAWGKRMTKWFGWHREFFVLET